MPTINYNIPADKQTDVLDALRLKFGAPGATAQQLQTLVENRFKAELIQIYRDYMRQKAFDVSFD